MLNILQLRTDKFISLLRERVTAASMISIQERAHTSTTTMHVYEWCLKASDDHVGILVRNAVIVARYFGVNIYSYNFSLSLSHIHTFHVAVVVFWFSIYGMHKIAAIVMLFETML